MTNEQMEAKVRAMIEEVYETQSDAIIGMIQPRFVSCDVEEQTLTLAYPAQSWERNPIGLMQGGIVATLLDYSVACLAVAYSGEKPVTVSLQVSYLRGAPVGGEVIVRVKATKVGRTLIHAFAECWEAKSPDKLVATANVAYMAG